MINLDRLVTWLNQSTLQQTNNPLYQLLKTLIQAMQEFQSEQAIINESTSGIVTGLENLDFLTHSDEAAILPNSRQLVAGDNVSFDDTVINQRIIDVTIPEMTDYVVMSDGANPANPLNDGNGNFIYIQYTP